ncbi:hypothetical protein [Domibacillus iocasae]|uniref:Uncharacterized protein n=1 Tax=Domibacillus iocasae TaxID=1714016 RepID=A0A1E7DRX7_9BACI|nr:hypothetical protein [Domibacillus iocasae]OES45827.1 hypothetical protein BA724_03215 [Domibacillus iocasae]
MTDAFINIKEYIPIIVAVISAMLAFSLGKLSERGKKFSLMVEDSMDSLIAKMYKEALLITNVNKYNVKKVKKFILFYSNNDEIYKLYDDKLISNFHELSIKIREGSISNKELIDEFFYLTKQVEKHYWEKLMVSSKDLNWWIKKKTINRWISLPGNILFLLKEVFEYICIILALIALVALADVIVDKDNEIFSSTFRIIIFYLTTIVALIYCALYFFDSTVGGKGDIKRKHLIKKKQ